ncbi:hypothetical protein LB505_003614 [Fusarium chuoi]|nr:hypothetical protein LB505_003614 [Fusarium chuoi]
MDVVEVYRGVFYGYSVMGVLKLISAVILSSAVEVHHETEQGSPADNGEQAPLLPDNAQAQGADQPQPKKQLRARISRDTHGSLTTSNPTTISRKGS